MYIWHFILDWTGSNNGFDALSTHVYNFVSGFGSDLGEYTLVGAIVGSAWRAEKRHREHMKELRLWRSATISAKTTKEKE